VAAAKPGRCDGSGADPAAEAGAAMSNQDWAWAIGMAAVPLAVAVFLIMRDIVRHGGAGGTRKPHRYFKHRKHGRRTPKRFKREARAMKMKTVKTPKSQPVRLVYAEAGSLAANPHNWRTHPGEQMVALEATLAKVGWAGALLYNERTQRLIDGHARQKAVPPETVVPVLVGDWTEEQEKFILATHDPLAGMALPDGAKLRELLGEVQLDASDFGAMLKDLDAEMTAMTPGTAPPPDGDSPEAKSPGNEGADAGADEAEDSKDETAEQNKGADKLASSFQVVAVCQDEQEQQRVFELVKAAGVKVRLNTLH